MSSEYYRLALLQRIHYDHQMEHCLNLQDDITILKEEIATRHKKHRRCDREISKKFECGHCERVYASDIARKLHWKLKHKNAEERTYSTEDSRGMNQANSQENEEGNSLAV